MDNYNILGRIGEGAHGVVFKAKQLSTGRVVALKKIPPRRPEEGISNAALREIKALQQMEEHENIVSLLAVFTHGTSFVLVFEYMASDLAEVLHTTRGLTEAQVKSYMQMLLRGVAYCHGNHIIHRDLKPANLLISSHGYLKIADFGLARVYYEAPERLYSHQVATRWYRPPELLYGARKYDNGVDLWAVGCIFAEMINNSPLFPGENDIDQMCTVFRVLGSPNSVNWPGVDELPDYNKITFEEMPGVPLDDVVSDASTEALNLIKEFLVYQSSRRISADKALLHPYFFTLPLPAHHSELPAPTPKENKVPVIELDQLGLVDPSLLPL